MLQQASARRVQAALLAAGAAWVLWRGDKRIASGCSRNETLARQAARKARNQLTGRAQYNAALRRYRYAPSAQAIYAQLRDRHGSFAAWNSTINAAERIYRIAIVLPQAD